MQDMDRTRQAQRADRISRTLEGKARDMLRPFLARPGQYIDCVLQADDDGADNFEFERRIQRIVSARELDMLAHISHISSTTLGEDAIGLGRWARRRIVYSLDKDAAHAIKNTEWGPTPIPGEILQRLPYPDPMIILPEPICVADDEGSIEQYDAFILLGITKDSRRCSTHDPRATHLGIHYIGRVVETRDGRDKQAQVVGLNGTMYTISQIVGMRVVTPMSDMSMDERAQWAVEQLIHVGASAQIGFTSTEQAIAVTEHMCRLALAVLVYLASDTPDAIETRVKDHRRRSKQGQRHGAKESTVIELGWRLGAALRAGKSGGHGEGAGRSVSAHMRRAHVHTYRTGKGRTGTSLRWLPPIAVGYRDGKKEETTQVHLR